MEEEVHVSTWQCHYIGSLLHAIDIGKLVIAGIVRKLSIAAKNLVGRNLTFKARTGKSKLSQRYNIIIVKGEKYP